MFIRVFGNGFLLLFALDGALSLLLDGTGTDASVLIELYRFVRLAFHLLIPAAIAMVPLTPDLPGRVLLPPALFGIWRWLGAAPLPACIEDPLSLSFAVDAIQLVLAATAFATLRFATPRLGRPGHWTLPASPAPFRWRRFLAYTAGMLLLGPPLLAAYALVALGTGAHRLTGGFIAFDGQGIQIVERHYRRDPPDRRDPGAAAALDGPDPEIWLIGMIHLGREGYDRLFDRFESEGTLVLEEGVTDDHDVLVDRMPYDSFAEPLGLERQHRVSAYFARDAEEEGEEEEESWPEVRRVDLDASEFSPETLAYLAGLDGIVDAAQQGDWPRVRQLAREPGMQATQVPKVMNDIITRRDVTVAAALQEALPHYRRIVVPWGAIHQRNLSYWVKSWGFHEVHSEHHLAIEWSRLWKGLLQLAASGQGGSVSP